MDSTTLPILPSSTDIVFVDTLHGSCNIGQDCWNRDRAQPIDITVYLHLQNSYLQTAGTSDNIHGTVNYSHLSKVISGVMSRSFGINGVDGLIHAIAQEAFSLAGEAAAEVRVVVDAPKMILLADGFIVDVTYKPDFSRTKKVLVKDIILPVIIGINHAEREAKQRVITNITFYELQHEEPLHVNAVDYPAILSNICQEIEACSYLTLEKFVMQVVRSACLSSEKVYAATARGQKPSAISFARSSGVEITRQTKSFTTSAD